MEFQTGSELVAKAQSLTDLDLSFLPDVDTVRVSLVKETGNPLEEFEQKKKLLLSRKRVIVLVSELKGNRGFAMRQLSEAMRVQEQMQDPTLTEWQKLDLTGRQIVAEAEAEGAIATIHQCEMELKLELAFLKELGCLTKPD